MTDEKKEKDVKDNVVELFPETEDSASAKVDTDNPSLYATPEIVPNMIVAIGQSADGKLMAKFGENVEMTNVLFALHSLQTSLQNDVLTGQIIQRILAVLRPPIPFQKLK
jgi:hypothetical protein